MPWTAKQHLWKSKGKEGSSVEPWWTKFQTKKNDIKNCHCYVVPGSVNFKIKWQAKPTGPKFRLIVLVLQKKGEYPRVGTLIIYM